MTHTLRPLCLLALPLLALAACNTGTTAGKTNVELASPKEGPAAAKNGVLNGDSAAAGIGRDTLHRPTGKQIFENTEKARDLNHDGIAD